MLGIAAVLFEWNKGRLEPGMLRAIRSGEAVVLLVFGMVELLILSGIRTADAEKDCRYVIVLGAKVDGDRLTDALKQRLDRAAEYLHAHEETKVIVSGGQGSDELVPEAYVMADYLKNCGIEPDRILQEDRSTTTRENLIYSGKLILRDEKAEHYKDIQVGVVTNSFHMYRAVCIARQVGYNKVLAIAAPTTRIMFANYMTREFFGVLKMWAQRNQKD